MAGMGEKWRPVPPYPVLGDLVRESNLSAAESVFTLCSRGQFTQTLPHHLSSRLKLTDFPANSDYSIFIFTLFLFSVSVRSLLSCWILFALSSTIDYSHLDSALPDSPCFTHSTILLGCPSLTSFEPEDTRLAAID